MKIKKGDTVVVTSGKDRGKKGKVIEAFPKEGKVIVEGVNLKKKHIRPKKSGEKGQIIEMPSSFDASDVKVICKECGKATRVGFKKEGNKKVRICKKCGKEL